MRQRQKIKRPVVRNENEDINKVIDLQAVGRKKEKENEK
jgi:hypothetical protein